MTDAPLSHIQEGQKLTADGLVDLFKITLKNQPVIWFFKAFDTATWQGDTYEGVAMKLTGDARTADGQENRANLRIFNPNGVFNAPAITGDLDLAVITRKRVLRQHLESDTNIFEQRMWFVGKVTELIPGQSIALELRNMSEGQNFQIPARQYTPSDGFPFVTL